MEVFALKVEDPGCFWVTMKECGPFVVDEVAYKKLNDEINQFYDKSYKDAHEVKPVMVEEGQVCVVFSEELRCWCRAVIKSVMYCTDNYQMECFLVDYAKYIFVKSKDIQVAMEPFMQLPYRAKKCRLYRTRPVTLRIDLCEETAKIVPAKRWDSAATWYFQNLLKASTHMTAKLCAIEDNTFDVFLYVTIKDEKVCVNDDLVSKNFARFEEAEENTGSSADYQENQTSLNAESLPLKIVSPALAFRPVLFQKKIPANLGTGLPVSSSSLEDAHQRLSADPDLNTVPVVKEVPDLPFKENTEVHTDKLQQCLNSDLPKTNIVEDDQQSSKNLSEERNLVFLSNKIEPSSSLETAPLFHELKKELTRKQFLGPNFTESYCWPSVARGCDVVAISYQGNDPFIYVPPLLTLLQLEGCYKAFTNKSGPLALILCPGWKKAQLVFELLKTYERCSRQFHPMLIILGQNKAAASSVKIQGCEVIVTTPYSFLRLFEHHNLFCRLCHLVLDEMEVLFSDAAEQVFTILDCYKKATASEEWEYSPHQIIAVGTHWNKHIAHLIKEFMNDPYVVITAMEEASIYGNVQQVVQPCVNSERISVLLKILDFTHNNPQKVLVFTNSVNEVDAIHEALKSNSIFSLKIHKESNSKYVLEQWTEKYNSGSPVLLVSTDDCMQSLGITDATCVIHFSFPSSRIFGQRLHSMSDNFSNDSSADQEHTKARSVILLTENSDCHALGILRFLQHAEAEIPPELHDFTAKMLEAEEDKKSSRPLCAYLKTFGICKNRTACPDRHQINMQMDIPQNIPDKILQAPGCVTILPLHIVSATNYFGRIVDKEKDQYTILAKEINEYFENPSNRISVKEVKALALYGLCEKRLFHRVQVLEIYPQEEENLFFSVKIKYIDEGRASQGLSCQLLHLPARFQCLPPQAVEFVVCRVKPIDKETEWNPEVTHYINHKIKGKLHEAKIVHTLGNTAWIDQMVRITRLSELKITANEYNVRSEILSTGLGTDNPEHITQLQKLCGHLKLLDHTENLDSLSIKEDTADPENTSNAENMSNPQNMSAQENSTENCSSSKITFRTHSGGGVRQSKDVEDTTLHQRQCFHPQIKWFQNEETVTVKVEIASTADHKCEFSKEKVIFSACSGDKFYLADMELHQRILAEKSTCVIKDKEVVIILVKEQKGSWCKLLKNKNNHVSLDFEHWEDCEDDSPFPGTKKVYCTGAVSEDLVDSSEVSGTESDD
ncbi:putative ATP-dependent RNA helicase TDRD12 isoform X2 [Pezoporus wallicus]|uniref:putative ATP-dependent RNA helicase TDRD12 isoform X2 n=1 Tax=Pezoporus wallicus TaxID=35540 RepID=UPI0025506CB5|nr:putative ATP-dependent RNA helicase TDRD12 isoform X2 [Pezoporus wallicus]XP_061325128.1 putative ATP-dependent RNA helicase TDRD12 isoform X2 [Pezoporus flaviventris]